MVHQIGLEVAGRWLIPGNPPHGDAASDFVPSEGSTTLQTRFILPDAGQLAFDSGQTDTLQLGQQTFCYHHLTMRLKFLRHLDQVARQSFGTNPIIALPDDTQGIFHITAIGSPTLLTAQLPL